MWINLTDEEKAYLEACADVRIDIKTDDKIISTKRDPRDVVVFGTTAELCAAKLLGGLCDINPRYGGDGGKGDVWRARVTVGVKGVGRGRPGDYRAYGHQFGGCFRDDFGVVGCEDGAGFRFDHYFTREDHDRHILKSQQGAATDRRGRATKGLFILDMAHMRPIEELIERFDYIKDEEVSFVEENGYVRYLQQRLEKYGNAEILSRMYEAQRRYGIL